MAFFFLAPFFAVGMLRPLKWWSEVIKNRTIQIISFAWLFLVHVLGEISPFFFEYLHERTIMHPLTFRELPGLSPAGVGFLLWHEFRFLSLGLPGIFVLSAIHECLERIFPNRLMEAIHGWGARSIYIYALHWPLSTPVIRVFAITFPAPGPYPVIAVIKILLAVANLAIWGSRFSELCFGWLVLPYWIKRCVSYAWQPVQEVEKAALLQKEQAQHKLQREAAAAADAT